MLQQKIYKMLGHIEKDILSLKPTIASSDNMSSPTKRIALIELSSVYDLIGLFFPILFRGKDAPAKDMEQTSELGI